MVISRSSSPDFNAGVRTRSGRDGIKKLASPRDPVATALGSDTQADRSRYMLAKNVAHLVDQFLIFKVFGFDLCQLLKQLALLASKAGRRDYRN